MSNKNPVYIVQHNHFDPIWRRCWDRTFDYKGVRYRSYADLEEYFFNIWLESAKKGATVSEAQSVVLRKYIERNPERFEEVCDLVEKGVLEVTAGGETVADTNMPSGETLLRNLAMGQWFFEDAFDVIPSIGWLEDAFGQSAQIPQIFRGCESNSVWKLSYKKVPGNYWKGLDGSVIYMGDAPYTYHAGFGIKIAPCPECQGAGCEKCAYPGLGYTSLITDEDLNAALHADYQGDPYSMLSIGGEESVPNPRLTELVEKAKKETGTNFVYGTYQMAAEKHLQEILAKLDDPNLETSDQVEANPVSTGCYVTRIKIKQEFRRVENLVNTAERWATIAYLMGMEYPIGCLTEAWRNVIFVAFHDAITSTHIDAAYYELLDMMAEAEHEASHVMSDALDYIEQQIAADTDKDYLLIYNSESWKRTDPITITLSGTCGEPKLLDVNGNVLNVLDAWSEGSDIHVTFAPPAVPALGYTAVEVIPDSKPINSGNITAGADEVENDFFKIKVSDKGIESIIDKRSNKEILDTNKYLANELILEEDIGHPWGTMKVPGFEESLSQYTTQVKIRKAENVSEIMLTGQYKGIDENVKLLTWRQSVKLYAGLDRIDFHTEIDWDTAQRRIRVAFPTNIKKDSMMYSIPYGAIERAKYEPEIREGHMPSTNGDWPAINWVDVYSEEENRGVALINTGMPSHKIEDGVVFISVLRSPTDSWCLNEPEFYDCPDFDGARDAGFHAFDYSLVPHAGDYKAANIEKRGREVNNPLMIRELSYVGEGELDLEHSFIEFDATDNVIITTIKKAERDDSVVVRMAETDGKPGEASVKLEGAGEKATLVNFIERQAEQVSGKIEFSPFKIKTINLAD